jgi:hypothetical protein
MATHSGRERLPYILSFEITVQRERNPKPQPIEFYKTKQSPSHQRSACKEMGRAHNQAIDMNDKNVASKLQQSKWAGMFYQVMLSRRDIATTS